MHEMTQKKLNEKAEHTMKTFLEDVANTITSERMEKYGRPAVNYMRIAGLWSSVDTSREFYSEKDVVIAMILTKIGRLMESPTHKDSWQDIAGYAAVGWSIVSELYKVDDDD